MRAEENQYKMKEYSRDISQHSTLTFEPSFLWKAFPVDRVRENNRERQDSSVLPLYNSVYIDHDIRVQNCHAATEREREKTKPII